jgi:hypothetical protein
MSCLNYFGLGMSLIEMRAAMEMYASLYYMGTWLPILGIAFFAITGYGQRSKPSLKSEKKA